MSWGHQGRPNPGQGRSSSPRGSGADAVDHEEIGLENLSSVHSGVVVHITSILKRYLRPLLCLMWRKI